MAGEFVQVLGKSAWFSFGACPSHLKGKTYTLVSSDGEAFELEAEGLCLARKTLAQAETLGDADVALPFKKATLAKVVEYLKYHKSTPPFEIRTPLESDNLVECGASKWDAAFINVDKELLFELLLASLTMDIPSLYFLAGAKAALVIKGKDTSKLIKDFKLANDLPEDEEEQLAEMFQAQWEKLSATPDESGLGGLALLMTAILQAAERNAILVPSKSEEPAPSAISLKSYRHASWRAIILNDWTQLANAPEEVLSDRDLLMAAVTASRGAALQYALSDHREDKKLILEAVKYKGEYMTEAGPVLKQDREFVREAISVDGTALIGASDNIRGDEDFIIKAARMKRGSAVKGAKENLRKDPAFILQCSTADAEAFKYADESLKHDVDFVIQAVGLNGTVLKYAPASLQADPRVVKAAVSSDPSALLYTHAAVRNSMNLFLPHDSEPSMKALKSQQDKAGIGAPRPPVNAPKIEGVPLTQEAAEEEGIKNFQKPKVQKIVQFSALSTMTANMGQSNYIAGNSYLDKLPFYERPETDAVTLMWGAVGNIGMRWKAFASADMLNANPEALMNVSDASKVLNVTACKMDPPEWYAGSFFDEWTRQSMLMQTAGVVSGGGYRGGENIKPMPSLEKAPKGQPEKEQEAAVEAKELGPLASWPALAEPAVMPVPEEPETPPAAALEENVLFEGMRVQICNLPGKSGKIGIAEKVCKDGKWKVRLDKGGTALLKSCYLMSAARSLPGAKETHKQKSEGDEQTQ